MQFDIWSLSASLAKLALTSGTIVSSGLIWCALIFGCALDRKWVLGFAALGLAGALSSFALKGAALTGDVSGLTDPEMLGLLWSTSSGGALRLQLVGLGVIMIATLLHADGRARWPIWLAAIGGGVALLPFVITGHIADQGGFFGQIVLLLHLAAAAFWLGILHPLRQLTARTDRLVDAADLGARFGLFATVSVPVLLVAGGWLTYRLVGSPSVLIGTDYGRLLIVKMLCVVLLLALATANKLRYVPAIAAGDTNAARSLSRSILWEWLAFWAILCATAVLTSAVNLPG